MSITPVLLMANPWGRFEWIELAASVGPWALGIDRRIRPVAAGAIGSLAILLLASLDVDGSSPPRIVAAVSILLIGVVLADRALEAPEHDSNHGVAIDARDRAAVGFRSRLEREFGRARRHGRGLVLLSITATPRIAKPSAGRSNPAAEVAPSRIALALETVRALLARELRLYSDVVVDEERVLALVPEVETERYAAFVARVRQVLEQGTALEIEVGAAFFPKDAVCVEALIESADRDRAAARAPAVAARSSAMLRAEEA